MSELILKGIDFFMEKTGIAGNIHVNENTERMLFLLLGIALVLAGAKVYCAVVSLIMFWGVTIVLCTLMDGKAAWGTIVTAFTLIGCLMAYLAFKWKTADSMIFSAAIAAGAAWILSSSWIIAVCSGGVIAVASAFFPLECAILSTVLAGAVLLYETGVGYTGLLAVCGVLIQLLVFWRRSERGKEICKSFFAKKSNI